MRRRATFFQSFRFLPVILVALVALSAASARQPRREGGLRKSTETREALEAAKRPPAKPVKPSQPTKPEPRPTQVPTPSAQAAPKEPSKPNPQVKPKSSDPLERAKEELKEAREFLQKNETLKAYREADAVVNAIESRQYDRLGVDGEGTKAEEFRQTLAEALKVAKESGERLNRAHVNPAKPLTFYF